MYKLILVIGVFNILVSVVGIVVESQTTRGAVTILAYNGLGWVSVIVGLHYFLPLETW